jgi:hypothetical protein
VQPYAIQRRYRELGRIRTGEKGAKGQPVKRDSFRLTSPAKDLLERAAELWGGTVQEWEGAPTEGAQYELATTTSELPVLVPSQDLDRSQYMEMWSAGGVKRRCDTLTELISGRACLCNPDKRDCQITTHLLLVLPQLPDLGVWRITTHGYNAAAELPTTVAMLQQLHEQGQMPGAKLAIENRTSKVDGKTHHFIVPVLRIPFSMMELAVDMKDGVPVLAGTGPKPALGTGSPDLPKDPVFADRTDGAGFGPPPPLPGETSETQGALATRPQITKLHTIAGHLGWSEEEKHESAGVPSLNDLTREQASALIEQWEGLAPVAASSKGKEAAAAESEEPKPQPSQAGNGSSDDRDTLYHKALEVFGGGSKGRARLMREANGRFGSATMESITNEQLKELAAKPGVSA